MGGCKVVGVGRCVDAVLRKPEYNWILYLDARPNDAKIFARVGTTVRREKIF